MTWRLVLPPGQIAKYNIDNLWKVTVIKYKYSKYRIRQ